MKIWKKLRMKINYLIKKNRIMKLKILVGWKGKISKANQNKSKISQTTGKIIESILKIIGVIILKVIIEENIDTQESIEVIPTKISITSRKMIKMLSYEMTNIYKKNHSKINSLIRISLKMLKIRYQLNQINFIVNIPKIMNLSHLEAEEEEDGVEEIYIINKIIQGLKIITIIIKIIMVKKAIIKRIEKIVDGIKKMKEEAFVILINIIIIIMIIIITIIIIKATIVMIIITIIIKIIKAIIGKITKIITSKIINSKIIEAKEVIMAEEEREEEED